MTLNAKSNYTFRAISMNVIKDPTSKNIRIAGYYLLLHEVGSSHLLFSCAICMHFSSYFLSGQFSGSAQLKDKSIAVCSQGIIMKSAVKRLAHRSLSVGNLMASCQLFHPLRHRQRASDGLLILINLHGGRC